MSKYEVIVQVRSARDLAHKKLIEKPATYVKVYVDELSEKTETLNDLENPRWNRTFKFMVDHKPKLITFEVKDDRTLLPNIKLGNYKIDVDQIMFEVNEPIKLIDGEVPLVDTNQGTLDVSVAVQPYGWQNDNNNNINSNVSNVFSFRIIINRTKSKYDE